MALPKVMPEQKQYRLFQGQNNYIYEYGLTNKDPFYTKSYNGYYLFQNDDPINCPIIEYKIEKIEDRFGILWTPNEISSFCEIYQNGTVTLKNFQDV